MPGILSWWCRRCTATTVSTAPLSPEGCVQEEEKGGGEEAGAGGGRGARPAHVTADPRTACGVGGSGVRSASLHRMTTGGRGRRRERKGFLRSLLRALLALGNQDTILYGPLVSGSMFLCLGVACGSTAETCSCVSSRGFRLTPGFSTCWWTSDPRSVVQAI